MRPIDADAVIEKHGDWYVEEGPEEGFIGTLKSLIDEQPTVSGWISVKDGLPDRGADILAFMRNGAETRIVACNYGDNVWYDCIINCIVAGQNITHWMPLPEAPKGDDEDG